MPELPIVRHGVSPGERAKNRSWNRSVVAYLRGVLPLLECDGCEYDDFLLAKVFLRGTLLRLFLPAVFLRAAFFPVAFLRLVFLRVDGLRVSWLGSVRASSAASGKLLVTIPPHLRTKKPNLS